MANLATVTGFTQEAFDAFLAARREPQWLLDRRREAWDTFQELDWPSRNSEEWMRTDIRTFRIDRFHLPEATGEVAQFQHGLLAEGVELAGHVASLNSRSGASHMRWAAPPSRGSVEAEAQLGAWATTAFANVPVSPATSGCVKIPEGLSTTRSVSSS